MSKAFASNDSDDEEGELNQAPVLPPGARNYITPEGFAKLEVERQKALAEKTTLNEATVETKARLRRVLHRIEFLTDRLNSTVVIDPQAQPKERALFGASVTVKDAKGVEQTWRIVGVDEMDLTKGWISWISPLAKVLLEKKVNDVVTLGEQRLTLKRIDY